jgi:hypothetical protein
MDIIPSVKDPDNIKWLTENQETFLTFMAENHSPIDLAHTYLNYKTFNDDYVRNMIKKIAMHEKKLLDEKKKRKKVKADPTSITEQKIEEMEKIADKIESEKSGEEELFED